MPLPNDSIDLHIHTNYSDGVLSPWEIIEEAQWRGVSAIAITDHDSIAGVESIANASEELRIEVVAGVELSCRYEKMEIHIVGLLIEPDAEFAALLAHLRRCRETRMDKMLAKLGALGIKITRADLPAASRQALGRPHIARALIAKKFVDSVGEAFDKYLGDHGPVCVDHEHLDVSTAIDAIRRINGVSILAHPGVSGALEYLDTFRAMGINGIETHCPRHSPAVKEKLLAYCAAHNLLPSGGSDFHYLNGGNSCIGSPFVPYRMLAALREFAAQSAPSAELPTVKFGA